MTVSEVANNGSEQKIDWLLNHLRCPPCNSVGLARSTCAWECRHCGASYPIVNKAISFIDSDIAKNFRIVSTKNISDHPYNPTAIELLNKVIASGGCALDCGAGSRTFQHERLIQVEIAPYENIDILAVNQLLPFVDECFDVVFSFDVLEHVNDPFAAANELTRVLKPGGILYIDMPFMQAEHGYPHHYFNATRMGLLQLFENNLKIEAHIVPQSGHPIHTIWSTLRTYHNSLPPNVQSEFSRLTVGQILSKQWGEWRETSIGTSLSEAARWILASTTQAVFSKPGNGSFISVDIHSLPAFQKSNSAG